MQEIEKRVPNVAWGYHTVVQPNSSLIITALWILYILFTLQRGVTVICQDFYRSIQQISC